MLSSSGSIADSPPSPPPRTGTPSWRMDQARPEAKSTAKAPYSAAWWRRESLTPLGRTPELQRRRARLEDERPRPAAGEEFGAARPFKHHGLGQRIGGERVGSDNRDAAPARRDDGAPPRVDDRRDAAAVPPARGEIAGRGRDRAVLEGAHPQQSARLGGIAQMNGLGRRAAAADVAAGMDGAREIARGAQPRHRLVDGKTFGDAAEIERKPPAEADAAAGKQQDVAPARMPAAGSLQAARQEALAREGGCHGAVEEAVGGAADAQRRRKHVIGPGIDLDGLDMADGVEARELAVGSVRAHQALDAGDRGEGGQNRRLGCGRVGLDPDLDEGAEERSGAAEAI